MQQLAAAARPSRVAAETNRRKSLVMSKAVTAADLGEPDLRVSGLQLWVHGREFPGSDDCCDDNWVRVTAHCGASGASVRVQGAILMVSGIAGFGDECAAMLSADAGSASLDTLEPGLKVSLKSFDSLGRVRVRVETTPDHSAQAHWSEFEVDQTWLPGIISRCGAIMQEYPIRRG